MKPKTLRTIFLPYNDNNGKIIKIDKIEIPKIQRDFAYGRTDEKNTRKRERFLGALYNAIYGTPITLDFVYGDIRDNVLIPLDGQQRLTTLFLLYWFASNKENILDKKCEFLRRFSYETRPSARKFCEALTTNKFVLVNNEPISEQIKDKNWFHLEWLHDATISSMLVMLDDINEKFSDVDNLFDKLENISFYFLAIKNMGLSDELYIKMNSRGKPLTSFEHFKAEFEKQLKLVDETLAKEIGKKIDVQWTNLIWQYRDSNLATEYDDVTDDEFLRYFIFICNIICYKNGGSPKTNDEFDLIDNFFTIKGENEEERNESKNRIKENVDILEKYFDCWLDENGKSIDVANFFKEFSSNEHAEGKIKTDYNINLFEYCLHNYADIIGKNKRKFTLNQIILLYTFITYRQNLSIVKEDDFRRRLRIINNLILNSSDQISDSEERQGGNRLPAILRQVDSILLKGIIAEPKAIGANFNPNQLQEEKEKLEWTKDNPSIAESLYALEDHPLLYGQISILGLENPEYFERFKSLFNCDWDLVDCALFTIGDYKQSEERKKWRYQLGSSMEGGFAWKTLFHRSDNLKGFDNTKAILKKILSQKQDFSNESLSDFISEYLKECENTNQYPWIYYYVKYPIFRNKRYGKYCWIDFEKSPYVFITIYTQQKLSQNSYNPFLKEISEKVYREHNGNYLFISDDISLIENQNSYTVINNDENESVNKVFYINQNAAGIDTENRIEKMKVLWNEINSNK